MRFINELPTTNLRILISIVMSVVYVISALMLLFVRDSVDGEVLYIVGVFLLIMMGLDVVQFGVKRSTAWRQPENDSANGEVSK